MKKKNKYERPTLSNSPNPNYTIPSQNASTSTSINPYARPNNMNVINPNHISQINGNIGSIANYMINILHQNQQILKNQTILAENHHLIVEKMKKSQIQNKQYCDSMEKRFVHILYIIQLLLMIREGL